MRSKKEVRKRRSKSLKVKKKTLFNKNLRVFLLVCLFCMIESDEGEREASCNKCNQMTRQTMSFEGRRRRNVRSRNAGRSTVGDRRRQRKERGGGSREKEERGEKKK